MKNTKILICLLSVLLLTGCGSSKNKLVTYLEDNSFDCLKNVCVKDSNEKDNAKVITTYDIDSKLLKIDTKFTSLQTSYFEYNWETKKATYTYNIINDTFNTTYDFNEYEYSCKSEVDDEAYKKAECATLKEDIEKNINNFNEVIKNSNYEIK